MKKILFALFLSTNLHAQKPASNNSIYLDRKQVDGLHVYDFSMRSESGDRFTTIQLGHDCVNQSLSFATDLGIVRVDAKDLPKTLSAMSLLEQGELTVEPRAKSEELSLDLLLSPNYSFPEKSFTPLLRIVSPTDLGKAIEDLPYCIDRKQASQLGVVSEAAWKGEGNGLGAEIEKDCPNRLDLSLYETEKNSCYPLIYKAQTISASARVLCFKAARARARIKREPKAESLKALQVEADDAVKVGTILQAAFTAAENGLKTKCLKVAKNSAK